MSPKAQYTCKPLSCSNRTPLTVRWYWVVRFYMRDSAGGRLRGSGSAISFFVSFLLPLGIRIFSYWRDSNPSRCNTPVGCCSSPARRWRLLNLVESLILCQNAWFRKKLGVFLFLFSPSSIETPALFFIHSVPSCGGFLSIAYQKEREKGGLLHPKKFETLCCQVIDLW